MSFIRRVEKTLSLSTLGAALALSTQDLNGTVCGVFVSISKAVGVNSKVIITTTSTGKAVLTIADPSTLGAFYYPMAQACGTSGNALASSGAPRLPIFLDDERVRVKVLSTSGLIGQTVAAKVWVK